MVSNPAIFVSSFNTVSALMCFFTWSSLSSLSVAYDKILFNFTDTFNAVLTPKGTCYVMLLKKTLKLFPDFYFTDTLRLER